MTKKTNNKNEIVTHEKYRVFQNKYGYLPASDKNDFHIIKSRMLQGIYRNEKIKGIYCNYIVDTGSIINFMKNERIKKESEIELKKIKKRGRLTDEKRLRINLLSSQPLAFNIFLPLKWNNFDLATKSFKKLFPYLHIDTITDIKLEYVPGDENGKKNRIIHTDNSCLDVFVEYKTNQRTKSCIGFEVKYTESFSNTNFNKETGIKKGRYIKAIKKYSKQFQFESTSKYLSSKFNQLFRNQLITEEVKEKFDYSNCTQIVLHSDEDTKCVKIIQEFKNMINIKNSFDSISIEQLINTILEYTYNSETKLYNEIYNRYCNYELVKQFINQ